MKLTDRQRKEFDALLEEVIAELPDEYRDVMEKVPLIVDDEPSVALQKEMKAYAPGEESDICGLHAGPTISDEARQEVAYVAPMIQLFRGPLLRLAEGKPKRLRKEIRITLLHELGHYFDFDDDDLDGRGFG